MIKYTRHIEQTLGCIVKPDGVTHPVIIHTEYMHCVDDATAPTTIVAQYATQAGSTVKLGLGPGDVLVPGECKPVNDFDHDVMCDPDTGEHVIVVVTYTPQRTPVVTYSTLTGAPYAGDPQLLVQCTKGLESDVTEYCGDGATVFMREITHDGVPTGTVYWTNVAGAVIPQPAIFTAGACPITTNYRVYTNTLIAGASMNMVDIVTGSGSTKIMSVVVLQNDGSGQVQGDSGNPILLEDRGQWSIGLDNLGRNIDTLAMSSLTFTCVSGTQSVTAIYK